MKLYTSILLCFFSLTTLAQYELFWADEFDAPTLDETKWLTEPGGWGWGNNELQYYTDGDNLSIENDMLIIEAREEQVAQNNYTSGKIITKDLFEIQYGKVEARIKFPMGQGLWPAFWMLGANIDEVSWPACGEVDIMEHVNNEWTAHGTAHWDNFGYASYGGSYGLDPGIFHVYTIEWDSIGINWFIDGTFFHAMNIENGINGTGEFHMPFYLILNLAVGGNWPGSPDTTTNFPAELQIDYVRVYKTDIPNGIDVVSKGKHTVYPNPANDQLSISGIHQKIHTVELYSSNGTRSWTNVEYSINPKGNIDVDLSDLSSGSYFIRLNEEVISFIKL
jgi:beta-glucanase (GH16 family)